MYFRPIFTLLLATVGLLLSPSVIVAQTVSMHLTKIEPEQKVEGDAGSGGFTANRTGLMTFVVDSVAPAPIPAWPLELHLFCVELEQNITKNTVNSFQLLSADQAAKGVNTGASKNISLAGIGTIRARRLEILYQNVFDPSTPVNLTNNDRVAFQIAVWELSHDDDFSLNSTPSSSVEFQIDIPAANGAIRNKAWEYVNAVKALDSNPLAGRMALSVLHSSTVQDFLIPTTTLIAIPEPSAYTFMLGAMMGAATWIIRRRTKFAP